MSRDYKQALRALPRWAIYLMAVFPNLLWSGAYVTGKLAIGSPGAPGFGPFRAAFIRFAIAGSLILLTGLLRAPKSLRVDRRDLPLFAAAGILGVGLTYIFNNSGLALTSSTTAALIVATEPVWIALLAVIFLRERLTRVRGAGVVLGLIGATLVVLSTQRPGASGTAAGDAAILGSFLVLASLLFESGAVLTVKRLAARYSGWVIVTYEFVIGAIVLFPAALWEHLSYGPIHPTPAAWAALLYLIGPCTILGFIIWFTLLEVADASELSVFLFLQPVGGTLLGVIFLRDPFTALTALGAMLVLAGVAGITRSGTRSTRDDAVTEEILYAAGE